TGFLTAAQRDQLLHTAAPAVARWDEEQKKIEEQKKAEEEKKKSDAAQAAAAVATTSPSLGQPTAAPATAPSPTGFHATYSDAVRTFCTSGPCLNTIGLTIKNGQGFFTMSTAGCSSPSIPVTISPTGEIRGQGDLKCPFLIEAQSHLRGPTTVTGRVAGRKVILSFSSSSTRGDFTVTLTEGSQTA